ncbi:MAG: polyprenyl synthetase family protein [Chloroflexi bacterium]|nr:polyprenyl synthetase family protein [Chloroflexota bacterium]
MSYTAYFQRYLPLVEEHMQGVLERGDEVVAGHYAMMAYHLGWRDAALKPARVYAGKRVRPLLLLLATEAVEGDISHALPAAAAVEFLHNFSLLHDDVEDRSPTRRGRPTVWSLWGIPQAINVGDGMFALAYQALEGLADHHPAARVLTAFHLFTETALRLTEGQYLDMGYESRLDVDEQAYVTMIEGKTAALLAASTGLGALLGGAEEGVWRAYYTFGRYVGLTFQIVDDILGIWGDEQKVGKSVLSDILTKKKTYPVVYALTRSQVAPVLRELYAGPPFTERDVPRVVALLEESGAKEAAWAQARRFHERARSALMEAPVPATPARDALLEFVDALLTRDT